MQKKKKTFYSVQIKSENNSIIHKTAKAPTNEKLSNKFSLNHIRTRQ